MSFLIHASGLYLNIKKCEILVLKNSPFLSLDGIPVKNAVNYLKKINKIEFPWILTLPLKR